MNKKTVHCVGSITLIIIFIFLFILVLNRYCDNGNKKITQDTNLKNRKELKVGVNETTPEQLIIDRLYKLNNWKFNSDYEYFYNEKIEVWNGLLFFRGLVFDDDIKINSEMVTVLYNKLMYKHKDMVEAEKNKHINKLMKELDELEK